MVIRGCMLERNKGEIQKVTISTHSLINRIFILKACEKL